MRPLRKVFMFFVAATLCLTVTIVAYATVTFDTDGSLTVSNWGPYGFVGKGDVQVPFVLNDKKMTEYATANTSPSGEVWFTWNEDSTAEYDAVCEWETQTGGKNSKTIHHSVVRHKSTGLLASTALESETRKTGKKSVSGFKLNGLGSSNVVVTGGPVPQEGGACGPDDSNSEQPPGTYTSVTLTSSSSTQDLSATLGGVNLPALGTKIIAIGPFGSVD
jgi:hypothetical protein